MSTGIGAARVHALTHTGAVRQGNEDIVVVGDWIAANDLHRAKSFTFDLAGPNAAPLFVAVADGMGGHLDGALAARAAARYLADRAATIVDPAAARAVVMEANHALYGMMARGEGAPGMGTTLVALVVDGARAVVVNVGDSRAYRWRAGQLVQLSTDDTPGAKLADGRTAEITTPILTQSLGGQTSFEPVEVHVEEEAASPDVCYLLCSDGLSDLVGRDTIAARLAGEEGNDAGVVEALFQDAMDAGGKDNVSIALVRLAAS